MGFLPRVKVRIGNPHRFVFFGLILLLGAFLLAAFWMRATKSSAKYLWDQDVRRGRPDDLVPHANSWQPGSTIACANPAVTMVRLRQTY